MRLNNIDFIKEKLVYISRWKRIIRRNKMKKKDYMISKNFSEIEWMCKCGCRQCIIEPKLVNMMQTFRNKINLPITVHCVNRCIKHNKAIGGVVKPPSKHISGKACDFHVKKLKMKKFHEIIMNSQDIFTGGIGLYDWGVHVDIAKRRFWDNRGREE